MVAQLTIIVLSTFGALFSTSPPFLDAFLCECLRLWVVQWLCTGPLTRQKGELLTFFFVCCTPGLSELALNRGLAKNGVRGSNNACLCSLFWSVFDFWAWLGRVRVCLVFGVCVVFRCVGVRLRCCVVFGVQKRTRWWYIMMIHYESLMMYHHDTSWWYIMMIREVF